ncbi:MAG: tetratricopeptide repeat protein [Blastocatellia bacterium]
MSVEINLAKPAARLLAIITTGAICALLGALALQQAVAGMLVDERVAVPRQWLAAGLRYAPTAAPLLARLAESELAEGEADLAACEAYARRAANLSPWDYRHQLLLASIAEAKGDRAAAEQDLRAALALAPRYTEVHWRMANLLVRQGRVAPSLAEFRQVTSADRSLLPATFDLLWYASSHKAGALAAATPGDAPAQLALAQFLFKQGAVPEAAQVFRGIDAAERRALPESATLIDGLIARGNVELARDLWAELVSPNQPTPLLWNGSFEADVATSLAQFDWSIRQSDYLRPLFDAATAHSGGRSLRLEFTGRDTLRLDGEIKQLLLVHPQARYRLEFYVKARDFASPEGPRLAIAHNRTGAEIAASAPIAEGSYDWQRVTLEFAAPSDWGALLLTIKRVPKFSYDEPTRGTLWFDDFSLIELSN